MSVLFQQDLNEYEPREDESRALIVDVRSNSQIYKLHRGPRYAFLDSDFNRRLLIKELKPSFDMEVLLLYYNETSLEINITEVLFCFL